MQLLSSTSHVYRLHVELAWGLENVVLAISVHQAGLRWSHLHKK